MNDYDYVSPICFIFSSVLDNVLFTFVIIIDDKIFHVPRIAKKRKIEPKLTNSESKDKTKETPVVTDRGRGTSKRNTEEVISAKVSPTKAKTPSTGKRPAQRKKVATKTTVDVRTAKKSKIDENSADANTTFLFFKG